MHIQPWTPDQSDELAHVMSAALGRPVHANRVYKKYAHGLGAGPGFGFLLKDGTNSVGIAAAIPIHFTAPSGEKIIAAQYSDFGLFSDYRGQGIFNGVCEELHQYAEAEGAAFSYAFTSEGSRASMERILNHTTIGDLCSFDINIAKDANLAKRVCDRAKREVSWRRRVTSDTPATRGKDFSFTASRDQAFAIAKRKTGARFLKILGHAVMVRPGSLTKVSLPENLSKEELIPLLKELENRARQSGTRILRFLVSPQDQAFTVLSQMIGASPGSLKPCVYTWDPKIAPENISFGFADYENF